MISERAPKMISMYLPKRDELSFRVVLALPIASITGFEARILASICVSPSSVPGAPQTVARYRIANLALTVLPAPDSPDTMIDWHLPSSCSCEYASSATAKTCGGSSPILHPSYRAITSGV